MDGQTDRQTDGIAMAYTCYSIYAVARNCRMASCFLQPVHTDANHTSKQQTDGQAFHHAAPTVWNDIPLTIRESGTLNTFKRRLKSHLFNNH